MPAEFELHKPRYLYRYRRLAQRGESSAAEVRSQECSALITGQLHCSEFAGLNDPMEGQFAAGNSPAWLLSEITAGKGRIGICSFSETPNNELMWAHYANEFSGMCVRYKVKHLHPALPGGHLSPVRYSETVPVFGSAPTPDRLARRALTTKSYKWLYEREWRYLAPGVGLIDYGYNERVVDRVYLGFRMHHDVVDELVSFFRHTSIRVVRMSIEGYAIGFAPFLDR